MGNPSKKETRPDIRLNRYIARAGYCSRRKADDLISKGRVKINGIPVQELGTRVAEGDIVEVEGRRLSPRSYVYILMNKPRDTITTTADERGRVTVMDLIKIEPEEKEGLFPVGRLDRHTTGVLILTNDGELAHRLMHPSYEIEKLYRVRTHLPLKPHELDSLKRGVQLDDGVACADEAAYLNAVQSNEIGIRIHEGRNRQVRRMLQVLGHEVESLERVNYAGFTTKGIRPGKWRHLLPREIKKLRRSVKLS